MSKNKILSIFIVIMAISILFYILKPKNIETNIETEVISNEISSTYKNSEDLREISKDSNEEDITNDESQKVVFDETKKCFLNFKPQFNSANKNNLDQVLRNVKPLLGELKSNEFDWNNTHLTLPNNEILRIRVFNDSTPEGKSVKKLEVYEVDDEGLPIPTKIPHTDSYNPSKNTIDEYISKGKVFYTEKAYSLIFENNNYIKIVEINEEVSELEVHAGSKILKCSGQKNTKEFCECFAN